MPVALLASSALATLPDQPRATDLCVPHEMRVPNHTTALSFLTRQPNEVFVSVSGKARNSFLVEPDGVGPATAGSKKRYMSNSRPFVSVVEGAFDSQP